MQFYGRVEELNLLRNLQKKKTASLAVLRGRRRIGKSRLAIEFGKTEKMKNHIFSGLPPEKNITSQLQREDFAHQLQRQFHIPLPRADDWGDLFWNLAENTKKGRILIVLDEITWLGSKDPTFLGKLKTAWDLYFKNNPNLILIISGSVSGWIEKNLLSSTGFLGRISLDLVLEELPLCECIKFWGNYQSSTSTYDMLKIFSITGGIPKYLEEIYPQQSAEENIQRLCFSKHGFLFKEFNKIFHDLFEKRAETYKKIVQHLAKGRSTLDELYKIMNTEKNSIVTQYMEDLILAGFVARDFTWNIKNNKESNLSHFRLKDNYLRFFIKYISPVQNQIEKGAYESPRQLATILGLQFENLVLSNRLKVQQLLEIKQNNIVIDNPFFQRGTARNKGCQIDYMIQTKDNVLHICEIKFSKDPIGMKVIDDVREKLKRLSAPKHISKRAHLIHVNGVTEAVEDSELFSKIVSFDDFIKN